MIIEKVLKLKTDLLPSYQSKSLPLYRYDFIYIFRENTFFKEILLRYMASDSVLFRSKVIQWSRRWSTATDEIPGVRRDRRIGREDSREILAKSRSPFFQMAIQLHVKWWYPLTSPYARDSSFVSFCIPLRSLFVTISQWRTVLSFSASLSSLPLSLSPPTLCRPSGHGGHLATLFYVPIVTNPSLSLVDVTCSTGTRSRSPLASEAETLGARLLLFRVPLGKKEKNEKIHENCGEVEL